MDTTTCIGVIGAGLVLVGFLMNQFAIWDQKNIRYDAINLVGSACLVVYAYLLMSIPFLILNLVWMASALFDVLRFVRDRV